MTQLQSFSLSLLRQHKPPAAVQPQWDNITKVLFFIFRLPLAENEILKIILTLSSIISVTTQQNVKQTAEEFIFLANSGLRTLPWSEIYLCCTKAWRWLSIFSFYQNTNGEIGFCMLTISSLDSRWRLFKHLLGAFQQTKADLESSAASGQSLVSLPPTVIQFWVSSD